MEFFPFIYYLVFYQNLHSLKIELNYIWDTNLNCSKNIFLFVFAKTKTRTSVVCHLTFHAFAIEISTKTKWTLATFLCFTFPKWAILGLLFVYFRSLSDNLTVKICRLKWDSNFDCRGKRPKHFDHKPPQGPWNFIVHFRFLHRFLRQKEV